MYYPSVSVGEMNVAEVATIGIARACKHVIWDESPRMQRSCCDFLSGNELAVGNIDLMGCKASTSQGRTSAMLRLARREVFEDGLDGTLHEQS